ncbi:hypothetical protein OIU78_030451 [Salix suchowensis]|nr:hypothetical protein OIU78_030451 [Salix suchowensis]KAJ6287741.1 hypothetical protein OIU78_030451 [Salix suchowensis]
MDKKTSSSSVHGPQEPSNHDELLMQQSLLFSDTLKDLKSLRKQLYSAADYFELAYKKEEQKQIVVETLKDYAIKALINTVDHLGSVAFKVDRFLDQKIEEVSEMELRFSCSEQVLFPPGLPLTLPRAFFHTSKIQSQVFTGQFCKTLSQHAREIIYYQIILLSLNISLVYA